MPRAAIALTYARLPVHSCAARGPKGLLAFLAAADAFVTGPAHFALRRSSVAAASSQGKGLVFGKRAGKCAVRMADDWELTDVGRRQLEDLEGKWRKIGVLGGSKGVGKEIVKQLSAMGVSVTALVRKEESKAELEKLPGVKAVIGDALEAADVIGALDGCDAAISTLGGDRESQAVDYKGNMNMIENAGIIGVTRVILVTSIGAGDSKSAISEQAYNVLKDFLVQKTKAENLLIKYYTNTDYTIIRPGGLISEAATGKAILTEDKKAAGSIHRADVATLAIKALYSKKASQKILAAVDPSLAKEPASYASFQL